MSETTLTAVTDRFIESVTRTWNEGALDGVDEFFAEDAVGHNAARGEDYEDREAFKAWVRGIREEFPDFNADTENVVTGDDTVVHEWVASGTNEGDFVPLGVGATNEWAEWEGVTVYRFEDGKVVESRWYYDLLGMLRQLGLLPVTSEV